MTGMDVEVCRKQDLGTTHSPLVERDTAGGTPFLPPLRLGANRWCTAPACKDCPFERVMDSGRVGQADLLRCLGDLGYDACTPLQEAGRRVARARRLRLGDILKHRRGIFRCLPPMNNVARFRMRKQSEKARRATPANPLAESETAVALPNFSMRDWRRRTARHLGIPILNSAAAANLLGISPFTVQSIEAGQIPMTKPLALACMAVELTAAHGADRQAIPLVVREISRLTLA